MTATTEVLSPERIFQLGLGFWASKTLLSAVELEVFTLLAQEPMTLEQLKGRLGLQERGAADFFDGLVSLGMLQRQGGVCRNTPETDLFLDKAKPSYSGGLLEMANARLYPFWGSLTEALRTGKPQNEAKSGGDFFAALYQNQAKLREFAHAMSSLSMGPAHAIAEKFPWDRYATFIDVGTAEGNLPVQLALAHAHLTGGGTDLPALAPAFEDFVSHFGLPGRLKFYANDFLTQDLPNADVVVMGHILHDWSLADKRTLIAKAFDAVPPGGSIIVYDTVIDDDRRENTLGMMMSLNMLIETPAGFDYTGADCEGWLRDAGFVDTYVEPLITGESMVVGFRP